MAADVAIRFQGVTKRFRRGVRHDSLRDLVPALARKLLGRVPDRAQNDRYFEALCGIDLEIRQGETVGVIGHNGAGKSTMLKHLAGIMSPTWGRVEILGRLSALIEVGAGFHPDLTGRENVFLSGVILGMSRAEVARKMEMIVEFAGLAPFIDMPVKRYSSGMFARLGFAVAAHLEPDILVIDEVLSVGDFIFQHKSIQRMREIARSGSTLIFVSHNLKAVAELCQRTILLDHGKIVADGPTGEVVHLYLDREREKMLRTSRAADVHITGVTLTREGRPATRFASGDAATVCIDYGCRRATTGVSVVIQILDDSMENVFYTSTYVLGEAPVALEAGDRWQVSVDMAMNLASGTFHLAAYLHRAETDEDLDQVVPAATFFVAAVPEARGSANLFARMRESAPGLVVVGAEIEPVVARHES